MGCCQAKKYDSNEIIIIQSPKFSQQGSKYISNQDSEEFIDISINSYEDNIDYAETAENTNRPHWGSDMSQTSCVKSFKLEDTFSYVINQPNLFYEQLLSFHQRQKSLHFNCSDFEAKKEKYKARKLTERVSNNRRFYW